MNTQLLVVTIVLFLTSISSYLLRHKTISRYSLYLVTGITLSFWIRVENIIELTTLGVVFLLFYLGLRANPSLFERNWKVSVKTTFWITLLVTIPFTILLIYQGFTLFDSIILALAVTTGSSLVAIKLVKKEIEKGLLQGKLTESINLIHDVIVLTVLAVLSFPSNPIKDVAIIVALFVVVVVVRDRFANLFFKITGKSKELQLFVAITILLGLSVMTNLAGIGLLIGSFLAGMILSNHKTSYEIRKNIEPLKEFFIVILFVSIGLGLGIPTLNALYLAALLIALTIIVVFAHQIMLTQQGIHAKTSFYTAIQMDQVSEFVVIATLFLYLDSAVSIYVYEAVALAFLITSLTSLLTDIYKEKIFSFVNKEAFVSAKNIPKQNHVIIAVIGKVAHMLYNDLQDKNTPLLAIDQDPQKVQNLKRYIIGDINKEETWEKANYKKAKAIILFNPAFCNIVKTSKAKKFLVHTSKIQGFKHIDMKEAEQKRFNQIIQEILKT